MRAHIAPARVVEDVSGTRDHDKARKLAYFVGIAPLQNIEDGIGPRNKVQLHVLGIMSAQHAQRIDRIRLPRPIDFQTAHVEIWIVRHSAANHVVAQLRARDAFALLHPRIARRHENDAIEPERVAHLFCARKMPYMNRVERAPHDSKAKCSVGILATHIVKTPTYRRAGLAFPPLRFLHFAHVSRAPAPHRVRRTCTK